MSAHRLCPDDAMTELLARLAGDDGAASMIGPLLADYPEDARLHFLRGSLLAAQGAIGEAQEAMARAAELAPGFALGRFQRGLLLLTSGDGAQAQQVLAPLAALDETDPLRWFAAGLRHLIEDSFDAAIEALEEGIRRNTDNAALNDDMRMLVETIRARDAGGPHPAPSATHQLLRQAALGATRH